MPSPSLLTGPTLDLGAIQSSASIAHPWWSGDDLSPASSTTAAHLGLQQQSVGAISINPAYIKSRSLWDRVVVRVVRVMPMTIKRRASNASSNSSSSSKSKAANFAARSCPYSACNHAVCAAARAK